MGDKGEGQGGLKKNQAKRNCGTLRKLLICHITLNSLTDPLSKISFRTLIHRASLEPKKIFIYPCQPLASPSALPSHPTTPYSPTPQHICGLR